MRQISATKIKESKGQGTTLIRGLLSNKKHLDHLTFPQAITSKFIHNSPFLCSWYIHNKSEQARVRESEMATEGRPHRGK